MALYSANHYPLLTLSIIEDCPFSRRVRSTKLFLRERKLACLRIEVDIETNFSNFRYERKRERER